MKKTLFIITTILISLTASAQDYRCVIPGIKNYFINSQGYLRGMRIDSVKSNGVDIVLYPFHSARGKYDIYGASTYPPLDSTGGSWLGKTITIQPDGTHIFQNMWDTVIIKTQANVNDTWIFYNDTSATYYEATLTAIDTMTVLGSVDSIKRINITAKDGTGILPNDPLSNQQLIISKANGFVQTFDLYTFPMREPGKVYQQGVDYFLDRVIGSASGNLSASAAFGLTLFKNPSEADIADYNAGDVFEFVREQYSLPGGRHYILQKILDRLILNASQTRYIVSTWKQSMMNQPLPNVFTTGSLDTVVVTKAQFLFDTTRMPEEWGNSNFYTIHPHDTGFCLQSPSYGLYTHGINYSLGTATLFNCAWETIRYKEKIGRTLYNNCFAPTPNGSDGEYMTYSEKNGKPCGIYYPLDISSPTVSTNIRIYPNPVQDKLYLDGLSAGSLMRILDITGRTVYEETSATSSMSIDMSRLHPGNYLLQLSNKDGSKSVTKLVKY